MDRKILWVGFTSLAIVITAAFLTLLFAKSDHFRGTAYNEPYPLASDFELTHASGEVFHLSDQRSRIVLLFFGYTFCPDVCPATLAELNTALNNIPDGADLVQVVFVSVDPDRDTPQITQEYVTRFNPSFIGLSGPMDDLEKIWQDYDIFREVVKTDSGLATVNHTARVLLIDKDGNMRLSYAFGTPVEDIVFDLKLLLEASR
ncbi:MAG: SCO family protein [Chloroflexi bacterium]|nr:SCO family protein [Chloroflexota bacterium]